MVSSAAIIYERDAFQTDRATPMGRHFAGAGFLSAYARHSSGDRLTGFARTPELGQEFCGFVQGFAPKVKPDFVLQNNAAELSSIGCLFNPAPITAHHTWMRHLHGPEAWSLCGVNHTLSSSNVMDSIAELLTLPVQPWDALICTSTASRDVILRLLERQAKYLSQHLGATRFVAPQLLVIPLGVDCDTQAGYRTHRDKARSALGLEPDEIAVLFLGRLSFHAKAHPAPMYLALERVAARHKLVLIECGWAATAKIEEALADAKAKLCPSVRSIVLDGRTSEGRTQAWGAADIFCSLSDNIQETFGLTPIEAMAAGIPVVVTDWDGYKDTVRNGVDGFSIPTLAAPAGTGVNLAIRHAFEIDNYDRYIAKAATGVVVDIEATVTALDRLASDHELRQRMGAQGMARAREVFDWKVIVRAYERLWDELAQMRREAKAPSQPTLERAARYWPARPDPYELFASFPTAQLSVEYRIGRAPGVDLEEVRSRLQLKIALLSISVEISETDLVEFWLRLGEKEQSVGDFLSQSKADPIQTARALLWLAKLDLVRIRKPEGMA